MAKTIAVANMKGGVGKTTLVICLAESLAADDEGAKILIIDADPQASASVSIAGDEKLAALIGDGKTIDAFIEDNIHQRLGTKKSSLSDYIVEKVCTTTHRNVTLNISLLACSPYLRLVEKEIIRNLQKDRYGADAYEMRLWNLMRVELDAMKKKYDYIIFDCAPSISILNEVMIRYADLVILPTIPEFISVYGLSAFLHTVWNYPMANFPKPTKLPYVVVSKYQHNKQHALSVDQIRSFSSQPDTKFGMLNTRIPQAAQFSSALSIASQGEFPTFTKKFSAKLIDEVISPLTNEIKGVLLGYAS